MRIAHFINNPALVVITDREIDIGRLQDLIGTVDGVMYFYDEVEMKAFQQQLVVEGEVYYSNRVIFPSTFVYPDERFVGEMVESYPYGIMDMSTGRLMPQVMNGFSLKPPERLFPSECAESDGIVEFGYPISAVQPSPGMLDVYYDTPTGVKVAYALLPFEDNVAIVRVGFSVFYKYPTMVLIITESGEIWIADVKRGDMWDEVFNQAVVIGRTVDMDRLTGVGVYGTDIYLLEGDELEIIDTLSSEGYKFQHVVDASPIVFVRSPGVKGVN